MPWSARIVVWIPATDFFDFVKKRIPFVMIARRIFSDGVTGQSDSFKTCSARRSFAGRLKDEVGDKIADCSVQTAEA